MAFLGPTIGVFFDGAVFGALPMLVGRPRIAEANSIAWGTQNVIEIVLPSLVGLSLAVMHPSTLLRFDALSFVASAALVISLTRPLYDASAGAAAVRAAADRAGHRGGAAVPVGARRRPDHDVRGSLAVPLAAARSWR